MDKAGLLLPILMLASSPAHAAELEPAVFIEGGLHIGGGDIPSGGSGSFNIYEIDGGELLSGSIGLASNLGDFIKARVSFGVKMDGVIIAESETQFTRYPLEVLLFYRGKDFSIGAGVSYHFNPEFTASGVLGDNVIMFDDVLGYVVEVDMRVGTNAYIGIKRTLIDYEADAPITDTVNGDSYGVVVGLYF